MPMEFIEDCIDYGKGKGKGKGASDKQADKRHVATGASASLNAGPVQGSSSASSATTAPLRAGCSERGSAGDSGSAA